MNKVSRLIVIAKLTFKKKHCITYRYILYFFYSHTQIREEKSFFEFILYFLFVFETKQASFRKNWNFSFFTLKGFFLYPKKSYFCNVRKKQWKKAIQHFLLKSVDLSRRNILKLRPVNLRLSWFSWLRISIL